MSIFEKVCPQCASSSPVQAVRCRCGYCFEPELAGGEYAAQEERLYRDYLAARLVQAEAALAVARAEASADPGNQVKAAQALLAEQALNAARAELRAHTARTSRSNPALRAAAPVGTLPAARPRGAGVVARPAAIESAVPARAQAAAKPAAPKSAPQPPARIEAPRATEPMPPEITEVPGPAFRAVQTVKAEAAMKTRHTEPKRAPAEATRPATAQKADMGKRRRPARPVASPAPPPATKAAKKECPHCTALLPLDASRCRCGFSLPTVTVEMPPVALDADTLALLQQGLDLGSRR